jgi:hypothetical protein
VREFWVNEFDPFVEEVFEVWPDRRGEAAKKKASGALSVPYVASRRTGGCRGSI